MTFLKLPGARLTATSAEFGKDLTRDLWRDCGAALLALEESSNWFLGDWYNAGKRFLTLPVDQAHTEEQLRQLIAALIPLGDSKERVWQCSWVANAVPHCTRVQSLSWSHHREVARLSPAEQRRFLTLADKQRLSVADLRERIHLSHDPEAREDKKDRPIHTFILKKWVHEGVRYFHAELTRNPISEWSPERRAQVKREFAPLTDILKQL